MSKSKIYRCPGYIQGHWPIYKGRQEEPVFRIVGIYSLAAEGHVAEFVGLLNGVLKTEFAESGR